jgi:hypothetical protein
MPDHIMSGQVNSNNVRLGQFMSGSFMLVLFSTRNIRLGQVRSG